MTDPLQYYTARQLASRAAASGYAVLPARHMDLAGLVAYGYLVKIETNLPDNLALYTITDKGRTALGYPSNWIVHESDDNGCPLNFHVERCGDELHVDLTHPPYEADDNPESRVRYVCFDQEAVRASDGIRIHYDYTRDGYAIEQPNERLLGTETPHSYGAETVWTETAFVQSWACSTRDDRGDHTQADYDRADAEHREIVRRSHVSERQRP